MLLWLFSNHTSRIPDDVNTKLEITLSDYVHLATYGRLASSKYFFYESFFCEIAQYNLTLKIRQPATTFTDHTFAKSVGWRVPLAILTVFVGCASNVVFLELLVKNDAGVGNLVTFSSFLFISVEGKKKHCPALKSSSVRISSFISFFTNVLGSYNLQGWQYYFGQTGAIRYTKNEIIVRTSIRLYSGTQLSNLR